MTARANFADPTLSILEQKQTYLRPMLYLLLTFVILSVHAGLGAILGLPGSIWLILMTVVLVLVKPEMAFALMFSAMFFQNIFIALMSPEVKTPVDFMFLMATSFLNVAITGSLCFPAWMRIRNRLPADNRRLLKWMFCFALVIAVYSMLGFASGGGGGVAVYIRVYTTGMFLLVAGVVFGLEFPLSYTVNFFRLLAWVLLIWGGIEFFATRGLYEALNVVNFFHLKFIGDANTDVFASVSDVLINSTRSYLNLTGDLGLDLKILRPNGPSLHPITYAYCTLFCCLICYIYRSYGLFLGCLLLLTLIGAKGPIVLVLMSIGLYWFYQLNKNPRWLFAVTWVLMVIYGVIGIYYGITTEDYHVIGFLGGLKGFSHNPLGHGIGVGGNMSMNSQSERQSDFQFFQNFGADFGFESAIGVMIYQLGVASIVFFMFYSALWRSVRDAAVAMPIDSRIMIVPIVLLLLLLNGIFQEEAFSPAGWGLWLFFSGYILARHWRLAEVPDDPRMQALWRPQIAVRYGK